MKPFSTLLLLILFGCYLQAQSVVISAEKDNTIYEDTLGNLSNGAGSYLFAGQTATNLSRRALLKFDIAVNVPGGSLIDSVSLELYMNKAIFGSPAVSVHALTSDWGEGTSDALGEEGGGAVATIGDATWLHSSYSTVLWTDTAGDFVPTPSAQSAIAATTAFYTWQSVTMTADVQNWLTSPLSNFGWILIGDESTPITARRFCSREHATPAYRPALTVYYTGPPTLFSHPKDTTICAGDSAIFSVSGEGITGYQWQEYNGSWSDISNGGSYDGADSDSLLIYPTGFGLNGNNYRCIVTGGVPPADTSMANTLTVLAAPTVVLSPGNLTYCYGEEHTLSGPAGDNQWYRNGYLLPGDTLAELLVTGSGRYNMIQRNALGCTDSASTAIVVKVLDCTGTAAETYGSTIKVFPNPAKEQIWVSVPSGLGETIIEIIDASQRVVLRVAHYIGADALPILIPVAQLDSGWYMLNLRGQGFIANHRLVLVD